MIYAVSAPICLHECMCVCTLFQAYEQGGGTKQHQGQPAAISCAWQSCQNASARPLSFRSTGHAFAHQEMEGWDLGGVFVHKDRQICTKKGAFKHTQSDSASQRTGTPLRICEPPLVLSRKGTSVTYTRTEPGVQNLAFYKNITRLKLKQELRYPYPKRKNYLHSSLNFLLTLTDSQFHPCSRLRSLPCSETWADLPVTWQAKLLQENALDCQQTSYVFVCVIAQYMNVLSKYYET